MSGTWNVSWAGTWTGTSGSFPGERTIAGASELGELLSQRDSAGVAEFIVARTDSEYPYLLLSVANDRWYAHFFPQEADAGAFAVGDQPDAQGSIRLPAGSNIEVLRANLISGPAALLIATEFVRTGSRPTTAEWFEL